jgi:hypothetical protein
MVFFFERCTIAPWSTFPRDAEINKFYASIGLDKDVRGLKVAVRDRLAIRV